MTALSRFAVVDARLVCRIGNGDRIKAKFTKHEVITYCTP